MKLIYSTRKLVVSMKKIVSLLLVASMLLSLCACIAQDGPDSSAPDTKPNQTSPSTPSTSETENSDPTQSSIPLTCQHELECVQSIEATCTEPGRIISVCIHCGEEFTEELDAKDHSFSEATCTQAKSCTVCGLADSDALGHHYVSGKCDRCGHEIADTLPSDCEHDYRLSNQVLPTCTTAGSITYQCSKCSHPYTETISSNGHKYSDATCTQPQTCTVCAAKQGDALGHSYTDGSCIRCGTADPSVPTEVTYSVTVRSDKGVPIEGVLVSVYNGVTTPAATATTNQKGIATMTLLSADSYTVKLSLIPAGFSARESYTFKSTRVNINLTSLSYTTPTDHSKGNYKVGSKVGEFTLTDTDGISYTFSNLLKEKKLVILNFWYVSCAPCKAEFPYLEAIHQKYAEDVQLLTMSHWDTEESIKALRQQMGVTFPMIREDIGFREGFGLSMYPTTVFIDSTGKILKIDIGGYKSEQELVDIIKRFL